MDPLAATDPERIDGYVLEGRLGAGGYGVVYAATDANGRRVALKVLRPELADNPDLKERLAREGAALARIGGDRNVEIYDVVVEGTHTYLAMELVEGETLKERVDRDGPLTGPLLWFTAQGLLEALQAIHDAGITHRDLKPSNVMFGPDGVKVLDFGISAVADETGLTQTGAFLGTAAWISPEQILGREVTDKCDVFNLGLVVAFAATGRHAFGEGRPDAVMYRISNLDADLEGIDEPLNTAIRRCLLREPGLRPDVSELLAFVASGGQDDLPSAPDLPEGSTVIVQPSQIDKVVQAARSPSGDPPSPRDGGGAAAGGRPKRRKGRVFAALLLLAAVAGGGVFAYLQSQGSNDVTAPAATTTTRATTTTTPATTTRATTTTISTALIAERAVLTDSYVWGYSDKTRTLQHLLGLTEDGYYGSGTRIAHVAVLNDRGLSVANVPNPPPTTTTPPTTTSTVSEPSAPRTVRRGIPEFWESWGTYQVELTWTAPSVSGSASIKRYEIRISPTPKNLDPIVDTQTKVNSWTVVGLEPNTTYSFQVRAINHHEVEGPWSTTVSRRMPNRVATTTAPTTTIQIVTTTTSAAASYRLDTYAGKKLRWDPCAGQIRMKLNHGGYLRDTQLEKWETSLTSLASGISEATGLDLAYSGYTTEEPSDRHAGGRHTFVDVHIVIAPNRTGKLAGSSSDYGGVRWLDSHASSEWTEIEHVEIWVSSYRATSSTMWSFSKTYFMNYLGNAFGLDDLGSGTDTEIMSWGGRGSGMANDPQWGTGDLIGFGLVGANNGCVD